MEERYRRTASEVVMQWWVSISLLLIKAWITGQCSSCLTQEGGGLPHEGSESESHSESEESGSGFGRMEESRLRLRLVYRTEIAGSIAVGADHELSMGWEEHWWSREELQWRKPE